MDRYLDTTLVGPLFLRRPEAAAIVVQALQRGGPLLYYDLWAFVVLANQVHVLWRPTRPPSGVLQWLKGVTAREANLLLGRTGNGTHRGLRREQPGEGRIGGRAPGKAIPTGAAG